MKESTVNRNYKDRMELKLSAAFEPADKKAGVECTAVMLNINLGHNREIMEKCRTLKEYSIFVAEVRKGTADGYPLKEAIERAVDRCIEENILKDILTKNRAEVTNMVLTEYDEERHIANEKKISREEGREEGSDFRLLNLIKKKFLKGQSASEIAEDLLEAPELVEGVLDIINNNPDSDISELHRIWKLNVNH